MSELVCPSCGTKLKVTAQPTKRRARKDFILIKPRKLLGPNYFAMIANITRAAGGEYVSQGKQSHLRLLRTSGALTST